MVSYFVFNKLSVIITSFHTQIVRNWLKVTPSSWITFYLDTLQVSSREFSLSCKDVSSI